MKGWGVYWNWKFGGSGTFSAVFESPVYFCECWDPVVLFESFQMSEMSSKRMPWCMNKVDASSAWLHPTAASGEHALYSLSVWKLTYSMNEQVNENPVHQ